MNAPRIAPAQTGDGYAVLSPGAIPSTDIYFRSRARGVPEGSVHWIDTFALEPAALCSVTARRLIIVRHAPAAWLREIERARAGFSRVILFLDDDIPAAWRARELPLRYRLKTAWRFASLRTRLERLCDEWWVSTPELQRRYPERSPRLLPPLYVEGGRNPAAAQPVYFYHGTWAHRREIEWLAPVVRAVQQRVPDARFEIFGGHEVGRMFTGIERVELKRPMNWPDYLAWSGQVHHRLGLAPSIDTEFNRARAHVKLFDITRLGAAGIYARTGPCGTVVADGETGWLCEHRVEAWVERITQALRDPDACSAIHANALARCRASAGAAAGELA